MPPYTPFGACFHIKPSKQIFCSISYEQKHRIRICHAPSDFLPLLPTRIWSEEGGQPQHWSVEAFKCGVSIIIILVPEILVALSMFGIERMMKATPHAAPAGPQEFGGKNKFHLCETNLK